MSFDERLKLFLENPIMISACESGPYFYIYVESIEVLENLWGKDYHFCFRIFTEPQKNVSKPRYGETAFGSIDGLPQSAREEEVFWYTFTSRVSFERNIKNFYEFVLEQKGFNKSF